MAKYSAKSAAKVKTAMKEMKSGDLKSGKSNKKVTNPKQAIAIGLSEARKEGAQVPKKATSAKKDTKATPKKAATAKKVAPKKAAKKSAKKAASKN